MAEGSDGLQLALRRMRVGDESLTLESDYAIQLHRRSLTQAYLEFSTRGHCGAPQRENQMGLVPDQQQRLLPESLHHY